jgi:AraC-like DNA-binding protein
MSMSVRPVVRAGSWAGFRELVSELGGDPDAILAAGGQPKDQILRADTYVPMDRMIACIEIAAERLNRPDFGLLWGQTQPPTVMGAVAIAMLNAPTIREGLGIAAQYLHVHAPPMTGRVSPSGRPGLDLIELVYDLPPDLPRTLLQERALAALHGALSHMYGDGIRVQEVWFPHRAHLPIATYIRVFGVEPQFEQPQMGLVVERALLDAQISGGSDQIGQIAAAFLKSVAPSAGGGFAMTVAGTVRSLLESGACSSTQVARVLGLHERTLQRRLKELGLSFETIKDEARRDLAASLLRQSETPLSEVALILGYADASAFSRSCRRWFGAPPGAVRQRERMSQARGAARRPGGRASAARGRATRSLRR